MVCPLWWIVMAWVCPWALGRWYVLKITLWSGLATQNTCATFFLAFLYVKFIRMRFLALIYWAICCCLCNQSNLCWHAKYWNVLLWCLSKSGFSISTSFSILLARFYWTHKLWAYKCNIKVFLIFLGILILLNFVWINRTLIEVRIDDLFYLHRGLGQDFFLMINLKKRVQVCHL